MNLFESLGRHLKSGALQELTLTTNGTQLDKHATALRAAGVERLNISLDSLDPSRFKAITRWGDHARVMAGIQAAKAAGLKVKINTVAMRGVNEDEFDDLVAWCGREGFDLVFIETMPMGDIDGDRTEQYLPLSIVRANLGRHWTLSPISDTTGGPARYTRCAETGGRVGFITPMTHNFCESCNRVRLTCTGTLYMCLGQDDAADLRTPLRMSESDEPLLAAITEAITRKPKGHDFVIDRRHNRPAVSRHMSVTGG
jgi:cyclic pyranopterin phosphate synthase